MDLLRLVDRDDLEGSQLINRKFAGASKKIFASGDVPRRKIESISVVKPKERECLSVFGKSRVEPFGMHAKRSASDEGVTVVTRHCREFVKRLASVMRFSVVEQIDFVGKRLCGTLRIENRPCLQHTGCRFVPASCQYRHTRTVLVRVARTVRLTRIARKTVLGGGPDSTKGVPKALFGHLPEWAFYRALRPGPPRARGPGLGLKYT